MTDTTNTLPPLPEPDHTLDSGSMPFFREDQMRAYGDARAAHAVAQIKGEPVAQTVVVRCFCCGENSQVTFTHATAEQPAETREHILSAHIALSTCDGEGRVDKHHVQIAHEHIEAALGCLAATAPAPVAQAREITDAEIDALFESLGRGISMRDTLRKFARAAIALANGRGGAS